MWASVMAEVFLVCVTSTTLLCCSLSDVKVQTSLVNRLPDLDWTNSLSISFSFFLTPLPSEMACISSLLLPRLLPLWWLLDVFFQYFLTGARLLWLAFVTQYRLPHLFPLLLLLSLSRRLRLSSGGLDYSWDIFRINLCSSRASPPIPFVFSDFGVCVCVFNSRESPLISYSFWAFEDTSVSLAGCVSAEAQWMWVFAVI